MDGHFELVGARCVVSHLVLMLYTDQLTDGGGGESAAYLLLLISDEIMRRIQHDDGSRKSSPTLRVFSSHSAVQVQAGKVLLSSASNMAYSTHCTQSYRSDAGSLEDDNKRRTKKSIFGVPRAKAAARFWPSH